MIEALLLPLLMLNNLTADDFTTSANWSDCIDDTAMISHYYQWSNHDSVSDQYKEINSPSYFGLPSDTELQTGCGPVQWFYLHPIGPEYEVYFNNQSYSNTTELKYMIGYLPKPKKSINRISIDSVTYSPIEYQLNNEISTTVTVNWNQRIKRHGRKGYKKIPHTSTTILRSEYNVTLWPGIELYNQSIGAKVINHSAYSSIEIDIPADVSYYKVLVESSNHSAHFIKTNYIYYKLSDNCYYMEQFNTMDCDGMRPFGTNRFILPNDHYNVTAYAGSPFELIKLDLNTTHEDDNKTAHIFNKDYFGKRFSVLVAFMVLRKYNGPY